MSSVVVLSQAECDAAGALIAARHARERELFPLLPARYEDPAEAADLVRGTISFCDGVAALDGGGDLVGFLTSFESRPEPSAAMARYLPQRASIHLVQGHAVAAHIEAGRTYTSLFSELASTAVERGVIDFLVHVPLGDPAIEAAFAALGFGRANVVAVRDLAPIDRSIAPDVVVRRASPDELDIVEQLIDQEARFHAGSPIFRPYVHDDTVDAVRVELAEALAGEDSAFLIARRDGADVGVLSIGPGLGSPLYVPDGAAYIAATAVLPSERGTGAGAALVDAAFTWARERGHLAVCLHFTTANATSTSFWTGVGFTPVMAHLRRRLDERTLTHRPPA